MKIVKLIVFTVGCSLFSCSEKNTEVTRLFAEIHDINSFNTTNNAKIKKYKIFQETDINERFYTRAPSVVVADNGNIIAACEKKENRDDFGKGDIFLAVSADGGITYKKQKVFSCDQKNGRKFNVSLVIDRIGYHGVAGRIYCFCLSSLIYNNYAHTTNNKNESNFLYRYSDDNGTTWSNEFELRDKAPSEFIFFGSSPAKGIQLENGTMVVPGFVLLNDKSYRSGIVFKTPKGDWEFGVINKEESYKDSECTVIPFGDGNRILVNARNEIHNYRNVYISNEITEGTKGKDIVWDKHSSTRNFKFDGTPCEGSLEKVNYKNNTFYLFSYPLQTPLNAYFPRNYIGIWFSSDLESWKPVYLLTTEPSAGYSSLSYYNGKLIAVYESNEEISECELQDVSPLLDYVSENIIPQRKN